MRTSEQNLCLLARTYARPHRRCWAGTLSALVVTGCSGGEAPTLTLPKMPELPSVASIAPAVPERPVGSATEIYARVARGANTCWFVGSGPNQAGPLKKDYIYHAEADAPSRGGKAEIVIHVRDPAQPNPRGAKAYRINIDPDGDGANMKTENLKMPDQVAAAMTADVNRWAKGDQGCQGASTVAGWGAAPPPPPAAPVAVSKAKSNVKAKAAGRP